MSASRRAFVAGLLATAASPALAQGVSGASGASGTGDDGLYFWQKKGDPVDQPKDWVVPVYKFTVSQTPLLNCAVNIPFRSPPVAIEGDYVEPLTVSLACGRLPPGVYLDKRSGVVFGNSSKPLVTRIALLVMDNRNNTATTKPIDIYVYDTQQ